VQNEAQKLYGALRDGVGHLRAFAGERATAIQGWVQSSRCLRAVEHGFFVIALLPAGAAL